MTERKDKKKCLHGWGHPILDNNRKIGESTPVLIIIVTGVDQGLFLKAYTLFRLSN